MVEGAIGIQWVEARGVAKQLKSHRATKHDLV